MGGTRVYIGGLPYGVREKDLERFFKGYGRIRDILIKNGYGFVIYECAEEGCGKKVRWDKRGDHERISGHPLRLPNTQRLDIAFNDAKKKETEQHQLLLEKAAREEEKAKKEEEARQTEERLEKERLLLEQEQEEKRKREAEIQKIAEEDARKAAAEAAAQKALEEERLRLIEIERQLEDKRKEEERMYLQIKKQEEQEKLLNDQKAKAEAKLLMDNLLKIVRETNEIKLSLESEAERVRLRIDNLVSKINELSSPAPVTREIINPTSAIPSLSEPSQSCTAWNSPRVEALRSQRISDLQSFNSSKRLRECNTEATPSTSAGPKSPPKKKIDDRSCLYQQQGRLDRLSLVGVVEDNYIEMNFEPEKEATHIVIDTGAFEQPAEDFDVHDTNTTRSNNDMLEPPLDGICTGARLMSSGTTETPCNAQNAESMEMGNVDLRSLMNSRFDRLEAMMRQQNIQQEQPSIEKQDAHTQTSKNVQCINVKEKPEYIQDLKELNERRVLASAARSVSSIVEQLPHYANYFVDEESEASGNINGLICGTCTSLEAVKSKNPANQPKVGVLTLENNEKVEFSRSENQSREFRNLKKKVLAHESSDVHQKNLEDKLKDKHRDVTPKEKQAAMACTRIAYKGIIKHQSRNEYTEEVAALAANGLDVGDINHSKEFANQILNSLHSVLEEKAIQTLSAPLPATGLPPPVSVIADKATFNRRTYQIIGINAPVNGKMTTLYIDMSPVESHTGQGICDSIREKLNKFIPEQQLDQRLVGGGFDGQYFILKVPDFLSSNLSEDAKEWATYQHDIMHSMGLAEDKAKADKKIGKFQRKLEKTIGSVQKTSNYGKSFEALLNEQAEIDPSTKLKAPLRFSETRFSSHSHKVMENFKADYPVYYNKLTKDRDDLADTINHAEFVFELCASIDIYKQLGELSVKVQDPELFPWQAAEVVQHGVASLRNIANRFRNDETTEDHRTDKPGPADAFLKKKKPADVISNYISAKHEVLTKETFMEKPVFADQHHIRESRTLASSQAPGGQDYRKVANMVEKRAAEFADKIADNMETRFENTFPATSRLTAAIFSTSQILSRQPDALPQELFVYADLAKRSGYLKNDVSSDELAEQYKSFASRVHDFFVPGKGGKSENVFYHSYLEDKSVFAESKDVAHLLAASMTRTSSEAVVEGMASVAKKHTEGRGMLSPDYLNKEMFLHWNGPPIGVKADPFLRAALEHHFKGGNWHFYRTSRKDKLHNYFVSKSVDSYNSADGRLNF